MKKKILFIVCLCSSFMLQAAVLKTVSVTAGGLATTLTATEIANVTDLTVTGSIDARDVKFMRDNMAKLSVLNLSSASIKAYSGTAGTYTVSTIYPANELPKNPYRRVEPSNKTILKSIILPNSITSIGSGALSGLSNLTSIVIPSTVTSIGSFAFFGCSSLINVTIPNSVSTIEGYAFGGCTALTSVTLSEKLTTIGNWTFSSCTSLTNITLPKTITSIGSYAFYGCSSLTGMIIPEAVASIQESAFGNCLSITTINIPNKVKSISNGTFSGCSKLSSIKMSNAINKIGDWAFLGCESLTSLVVPDSVYTIGNSAFLNCYKLSSFSIPASVREIGESAFTNCLALGNVTIPNTLTKIKKSTFDNCTAFTSISIPNSVVAIEDWAFYGCTGLKSVVIGSNIKTMGEYAFSKCSGLTSLKMNAVTPIALTINVFNTTNIAACTLSVPKNSIASYKAATIWNQFYSIVALSSLNSQNIALVEGWNIISSNVVPSQTDLKLLFQPLIDAGKLVKVMDESGKAIENFAALGGWKNGIGLFSTTEGYRVKMTAAETLVLNGNAVVLPLKIPLSAGWNIISYPCADAQNAQTLVQALINRGTLIKVMDESGLSIEDFGTFGGWKNNIGSFMPGKGYKFYMTKADTLSITSTVLRSVEATAANTLLESTYFTNVYEGNGTDHMNINLLDLGNSTLGLDDEIGIFDGTACVGSAKIGPEQIAQGSISIPASCNDGVGGAINGFIPGNEISIKVYSNGKLYKIVLNTISGGSTFVKSGSIFASIESKELTGDVPTTIEETKEAVGIKCYPNPFVEEISIDVQNDTATMLTVGIYNMMGQKVKTIYEGVTDTIQLKWDATDEKGNRVIPGVYLCKVNDSSKKIVFTKSK